jgi:hypothetical protein
VSRKDFEAIFRLERGKDWPTEQAMAACLATLWAGKYGWSSEMVQSAFDAALLRQAGFGH